MNRKTEVQNPKSRAARVAATPADNFSFVRPKKSLCASPLAVAFCNASYWHYLWTNLASEFTAQRSHTGIMDYIFGSQSGRCSAAVRFRRGEFRCQVPRPYRAGIGGARSFEPAVQIPYSCRLVLIRGYPKTRTKLGHSWDKNRGDLKFHANVPRLSTLAISGARCTCDWWLENQNYTVSTPFPHRFSGSKT